MNEEKDIFDSEEEDELFEHQRIVVDKGQVSMRLDKYLPHFTKNISRNKIQNSILNTIILIFWRWADRVVKIISV